MNLFPSLLIVGLLVAGCGGIDADASKDRQGPLGLADKPAAPSAGVGGRGEQGVGGSAPGGEIGGFGADGVGDPAPGGEHPGKGGFGSGGNESGGFESGGFGSGGGNFGGFGSGGGDFGGFGSGGGNFGGFGSGGGGCGGPNSFPGENGGSDPGTPGCVYDASALPAGYPAGGDPYQGGGCPCTRRVSPGSSQCPVGDSVTQTAVVGPEGGTLSFSSITYAGVPFSLTFPAGAVAVPTVIQVIAEGAPPVEFQDYSPLIRLEPLGLVLAQPVAVNLGFELPYSSGYVNSNLAIQVSEGGAGCYQRIDGAYINAGFVQGQLHAFGTLFAGHLKPANLAACP